MASRVNVTTLEKPADRDEISTSIAALGDKNIKRRQLARKQLMLAGKAAVPSLVKCLSDPRRQVRWEAAKMLESIADPAAAEDLVKVLRTDGDEDVRWLAAAALVALGEAGLQALLAALETAPDSLSLLEGAHHVCIGLARPGLTDLVRPVLNALAGPDPHTGVPLAAYRVLSKLKSRPPRPPSDSERILRPTFAAWVGNRLSR